MAMNSYQNLSITKGLDIKSVFKSYLPYTPRIAGDLAMQSIGLGSAQVLDIRNVLLDNPNAGEVDALTTEFAQISTKEEKWGFEIKSHLIESVQSRIGNPIANRNNVEMQLMKGLLAKWDVLAYSSVHALNAGKFNDFTQSEAVTLDFQTVVSYIAEMDKTIKNMLSTTSSSDYTIGLSPTMVVEMKKLVEDTQGKTLRALVEEAYPEVTFIEINHNVFNNSIVGKVSVDGNTVQADDFYMEMFYSPDIILHAGMMPTIHQSGYDERALKDWTQFAYQSAGLQVVTKSFCRALLKKASA